MAGEAGCTVQERVLEIARGKSDECLVGLGKRAKQILDEYF